ncbi:MAG: HAD family phosphatase [Caulobacteraceae bacterium]
MAQPRAVLWDVGNVIVRWDPRTLSSKIFPNAAERDAFLRDVCTGEWNLRHDAGLPMADGIAERTALFPHHAEAIAAWQSRWWEMFSGPIPETETAINDLAARGVPQFGLTNMSHETCDGTFAMSPVFGHLRDIVVSGHHRITKPDPAIYQLACERAGLAPSDFVFVDDSRRNIEGAAALGFHVHRFVDPAALRPALEGFGLL